MGVKGFSERNLHRMKLIYEEITQQSISPQAVAKLHWGHTSLIFSKIKDVKERQFYLEKTQKEAWSRGLLEEKIKIETYALELVSKPMGIATYSYAQLPKHIAKNLPSEDQFKQLLGIMTD